MYLCRIGNSISGKTFIDSLIGQDDAEPSNKKRKIEGNVPLHYEHISSTTGGPVNLSRTPTEIVEPNDPMIEEFEEESVSLTASDSEEESDSNSWLVGDMMDNESAFDI
jgi:hypothetical protein